MKAAIISRKIHRETSSGWTYFLLDRYLISWFWILSKKKNDRFTVALFSVILKCSPGVYRNRMTTIQSQSILGKITLQKSAAIWTKFLHLVKNIFYKSYNFALSEMPHQFLSLSYLKKLANFNFFVPTVAGTFITKTIQHFITKDVFCFFFHKIA